MFVHRLYSLVMGSLAARPVPSPAAHARAIDHSRRADYAGRVSRPDPFRFPACEAEPGSRDRSVAGAPTACPRHELASASPAAQPLPAPTPRETSVLPIQDPT